MVAGDSSKRSETDDFARTEYSGQCYCGSSVADDRAPIKGQAGNCLMKCSGDENQACGGAVRSVFTRHAPMALAGMP